MRGGVSLFLLLLGVSSAAGQSDERILRRETLEGWTVTDVGESDGGRLVTLERSDRNFSIIFRVSYWRGNSGRAWGGEVNIENCQGEPGQDGMTNLLALHRNETVVEVRDQVRRSGSDCDIAERQRQDMLGGFDRPYCLFRRWAAEAAASTADEINEIIAHGTGELVRPSAPVYPDCRL